jgi:hypothetical protein
MITCPLEKMRVSSQLSVQASLTPHFSSWVAKTIASKVSKVTYPHYLMVLLMKRQQLGGSH